MCSFIRPAYNKKVNGKVTEKNLNLIKKQRIQKAIGGTFEDSNVKNIRELIYLFNNRLI
jgi:hypothetical protein